MLEQPERQPNRRRRDLLEGLRWTGAALRGRARLGVSVKRFVPALVRAVRPHFFGLSGGAALLGASSWSTSSRALSSALLTALAAALGWGAGQLLNDVLDRDTDAVEAPGRPVVSGELPVGPALAAALSLGLITLGVVLSVSPRSWPLALAAVPLLVLYNRAKRLPLAGNLAHGALVAVAALLGVAAAAPAPASLLECVSRGQGHALVAALNAALYLQANYEKDRRGDRLAGYRTLAVVLGVRGSAALRLVCAPALAALAVGLGPGAWVGELGTWLGAGLVALSCAPSLVRGTDAAALRGYLPAVLGAQLLVLAPAAGWLGSLLFAVVGACTLALVVLAFARSANP